MQKQKQNRECATMEMMGKLGMIGLTDAKHVWDDVGAGMRMLGMAWG